MKDLFWKIKSTPFYTIKAIKLFFNYSGRLILNNPKALRFYPLYLKIKTRTYLKFPSLYQMYDHIKSAPKGAIVELGAWKGGCGVFMAKCYPERTIWLFDSFEGCGEKHWTKYDKYLKNASQNKNWKANTMWKADEEDVYETCEMLGVKNVKVVKGFVQDTLPDNEIGDIAVLRLDMDLYESTKCALEILYDNIVEGGIIVFDDYGVKGFRGETWALHEFLVEQKLYHSVYWYPYKGKAYIVKKHDPDIKNFNDSKKRN